ncbi:MAG: ABC transporter ATP-binding protein [Mycobacteriales bacterium]
MTDPVITVDGVTKEYIKFDDAPMLLSRARLRSRSRRSSFVALSGLELRIAAGETLGVLGRNGAGKSTLLQLLCGVTAPSRGRVAVRGRVAPLISVGVGFHPELTGRENVYVNATILGMTARQITQGLDGIVDFAEIGEFLDTPVKFYSSGMFVRLGFAVAVAADPDVLLVDEVLAVGDYAFQLKCFERMQQIKAQGATIVVVSHNVAAIRGMCDRAIVLQRGQKIFDGDVQDAVSCYYGTLAEAPELVPVRAQAVVLEFVLVGESGCSTLAVRTHDEVLFRLTVRAGCDIPEPVVGFCLVTAAGVAASATSNVHSPYPPLAAGECASYEIRLNVSLASGELTALASLNNRLRGAEVECLVKAAPINFHVQGRDLVSGVADLGATFR